MRDVQVIAENLVAARHRSGMSLSGLSAASKVSKSTVHDIERGTANPRLDTLYAIADALDISLGDLIADHNDHVHVTRADDGAVVTGDSVTARLMQRMTRAGDVEVYAITLGPEVQESQPHRAGTTECLIVHVGTVEVGPSDQQVILHPGESVLFSGVRPHSYRSVTAHATATLLVANAANA
jgi:transcriptional regulator with XRE-family HTH domain